MTKQVPHQERKHSQFSASGFERYYHCPGSVALSEGIPSKDSVWSLEGTKAHEVLEKILTETVEDKRVPNANVFIDKAVTFQMIREALNFSRFILHLWEQEPRAQVLVETRISLPFIHPDMFGTFDSAVIDHFGTLHVFDYKYGAGVPVSPTENFQMIFYALGLAYLHHWNFSKVRMWIIQPRIAGYDGPVFWEISIEELKNYIAVFKKTVERVHKFPKKYVEGDHCRWCSAKSVCPLKKEKKFEIAKSAFSEKPDWG